MRFGLDCYACFLRQALEAARHSSLSEPDQARVMDRALRILLESPADRTPPEVAAEINGEIGRISGNPDPYGKEKRVWTERALELLPRLESLMAEAEDPLDRALRLAVAGNIIDLAPGHAIDLEGTLERVLVEDFARDGVAELRRELEGAEWVLYLGDNAGETVFDRVCIPALGRRVRYAVKGSPILNDATMEDALQAGLDGVAEVVGTGSGMPGTVLDDCDPGFRELFAAAPLILAKGQANYETLSDLDDGRVFFLLQVKCRQIARRLGRLGSLILTRNGE